MRAPPRWLILSGILILAALIAFPLRSLIHDAVIVPIAFLFWYFGLLYRSLSDGIWWVVLAIVVFIILTYSLVPESLGSPTDRSRLKPLRGPVESLALSIRKSEKGTYFKWLIANRLGKLAYQILLQRESGKSRSVFDPLEGDGWDPDAELQQYLESGLHASFADFPNRQRRYFAPPMKTPLDHDIGEAVNFLESQSGEAQ